MNNKIEIKNIENFSGVSAAVFLLMFIGTGYDIYITRKYTRGKNMIYDLERHAKLEQLAVRNQKPLSGKISDILGYLFLFKCPSLVKFLPLTRFEGIVSLCSFLYREQIID